MTPVNSKSENDSTRNKQRVHAPDECFSAVSAENLVLAEGQAKNVTTACDNTAPAETIANRD